MPNETRRLLAVLIADVVGYTQRMRADESDTFARLKALRRDVFEPALATHQGRLVKTTGDGAIVEFDSVVAAVSCGMAVQRAMADRLRLERPGAGLVLRIGIDAGEVIVEDGDLYGDAVNIAARLQALSPEGGMCLSRAVFEQARGRVDLPGLEDIGACRVHGLEQPVEAVVCRPGGGERTEPKAWSNMIKAVTVYETRRAVPDDMHRPPRGVPSIAVLPFDNLGGDPEQAYFADGICEDITTELSRFRSIFVISRLSAFAYRGTGMSAGAIGRELGVDYVLEGSVRRGGDRVRINVQLISMANEHHVWAEHYDCDFTDVFALQDEITGTVVATLTSRVEYDRMQGSRHKRPEKLDAYDLVLQGLAIHRDGNITYEHACQAFELFQKASEIDPDYGRAYSWSACSSTRRWPADAADDEIARLQRESQKWAEKALSLDDNDNEAHRVQGSILMYARDFERGEPHIRRALELNPNDAPITVKAGEFYSFAGRPDLAEPLIRRAMTLNPHHPDWYWQILGLCHFVAGDAAASIEAFLRAGSDNEFARAYLVANYVALSDLARAEAEAAALRQDGFSVRRFLRMQPFKRDADRERLRAALAAVGLTSEREAA